MCFPGTNTLWPSYIVHSHNGRICKSFVTAISCLVSVSVEKKISEIKSILVFFFFLTLCCAVVKVKKVFGFFFTLVVCDEQTVSWKQSSLEAVVVLLVHDASAR